ncbi:MAG: Transcriptional regulator, TrmB [Candidatus Moranbacteria bacterium GW2011_GWE2_35_2-]|nr:MAG: Transcriptional regulator, TrmB [Candidatus Moranbacteria bacterium GW2011_GWE2_35_2-]KKQ06658.1 MAG: Transcriptional regulator, TrmB [Candidatus Moranbacteria bacterium GW2011_GWF1_36_4]KKQ22619.1 MAG: Transcriptional regulator, TrmB [Candidatus Moranbacteria bacterium GW2011_GWF2_37_11]KKQ29022.1 MAG: Transcriptional regulator, TrmB [Candidatus Moranbacteria bacterium GW2011_GWD1_37_17]KKQ30442.1 MAG: Transcriptional regulator, TrmB [Candidatus Moranbacteria bacterium GW2011_GWE1_37_2
MEIKQALEQIGIAGKKADVYLSCLEMGGATAYLIAKKVGLKRPTVYDIINQLMKEGLVHKTIKGNIKYYSPADPELLIRKLHQKEVNIRQIMPSLQNLYNSPKTKPFIRYFEGSEGIKAMYDDSLKSLKKGDEILAYVGEDILNNIPDYISDYVKRRVEKGVRTRGIYIESESIGGYMRKNKEQLREARVLSKKEFPVKNETNIYANKVAIASYGAEMFGMIIESTEIANAQKAIFELAWKGAEKL